MREVSSGAVTFILWPSYRFWLISFLPVISNWYKTSFKASTKNRKGSQTESRYTYSKAQLSLSDNNACLILWAVNKIRLFAPWYYLQNQYCFLKSLPSLSALAKIQAKIALFIFNTRISSSAPEKSNYYSVLAVKVLLSYFSIRKYTSNKCF